MAHQANPKDGELAIIVSRQLRDMLGPPPPFHDKPLLPPLSRTNSGKKTLILDMDETLIHSVFKKVDNADFTCQVENRDKKTMSTIYIYKRPGVDMFL